MFMLISGLLYFYNIDMEYQRDEHRVHLIVYHLIWCPKRRKAVLGGPIAEDCRRLSSRNVPSGDGHIMELAIQPDHIHLFVRVWPVDAAAEVVKQCKGLTAHHLRQKYAVLRRCRLCGRGATLPPRQAMSLRRSSSATLLHRKASS